MYDLIMSYGQPALFWVLTGLGALLARYVWQRIKQDWLRSMLQRLYTEVDAVVREVGQTFIKGLKDGYADGKLTDEDKAKAKQMALDKLKSNIGMKGLQRLARVLGLDSLDGWLSTQVEAAVHAQKPPLPPSA